MWQALQGGPRSGCLCTVSLIYQIAIYTYPIEACLTCPPLNSCPHHHNRVPSAPQSNNQTHQKNPKPYPPQVEKVLHSNVSLIKALTLQLAHRCVC